MTNSRKAALITGTLFILAAVTSIIGLILYNPVLSNVNYLVDGVAHRSEIVLGAFFELVVACSLVGISITLFPFLKQENESLALGYVCFRSLESVVIIIGSLSVLAMIDLSQAFATATNPEAFQLAGTLLQAIHTWTFIIGPNFMLAVNTPMCCYLLYRLKLVPPFITTMGLVGATLIFVAALLEMFGVISQVSLWGVLLALPIFAYEMTLATWLIVKGFNPAAPSLNRSASSRNEPIATYAR